MFNPMSTPFVLSIVLKDIVLEAYWLQIDLVVVKRTRVHNFLNYFTGCVLGGVLQDYSELQILAHANRV